MTSDEGEIKAKRDAAARARRLLNEFGRADDRARLLKYVADLEAQADALERGLAQSPPPVTQVQMQVQQGPPSDDDANKDKKNEDET